MSKPNRLTRRGLLHRAAGAVAAPYIVSASALGRNGWIAPSGRLTVGFIGIGNMGGGHLGGFIQDKQFQVVAVCDVDENVRRNSRQRVDGGYAEQRAAGEYKGCDEYHRFEDLLARQDIDAILMAPPDHWHAIIAIEVMRSGKDVYCEKPLSLTIREADAMVAAARRYGRVFQTGSQQRSEGNFRFACELVRSGRIGKLQTVHVNIGGPSREAYLPEEKVRPGLDWNRWLGPAPWQPYNSTRCSGNYGGGWRMIRDYSGGMTTDWGAHHLDIAQWGMGMDGHGPIEIIPPDLSETGNLTFKYENGVEVHRSNDAPGHGGVNGVLFTGTQGRVEVNRGHFRTFPDSIGKEPLGPNDVHLYESPGHRQDWVECIKSRRRPICDVAIGASSVTVCHLANIAYWTRRRIKWDPIKRDIVGDDEARRWLDRPKRAPWRL